MNLIKKSLPHLIAIAIFLILASIYFYPDIFEGKTIQQSDMQKVVGMGHELDEFYTKEKGSSAWTNSMFSGMPSYHIYIHGIPANYLDYIEKPIKSIDYGGASMILVALICFYILMCVIGAKHWLAIAGSIAFAFASYNFILVAVGHITKMYVIGYMPLTVAGMILLFRKKWLWGTILFFLGIAFSIMNGHVQITYYLALFCILFFLGLLTGEILQKKYSVIVKACGLMAIAVIIALLPSLGGLYSNYEVGQESLRGHSELTTLKDGIEEKVSTGLDIGYAFNWSYGRGELLTLLIPYTYGGASVELLGQDSEFYKILKSYGQQLKKEVQAPTYWGSQLSGTSGPVYFGAIVCFLFVLGLFVIKNPLKWWIAGASLLLIIMSLGENFAFINNFLFYHLPMYNKFRVPSMALVIPGLTFPFIGFWGLKRIVEGKVDARLLKIFLICSLCIVGGICLFIWVAPDMFLNFRSVADTKYQMPEQLQNALIADRRSMASSDAFRSLVFILLTGGLIFYFLQSKNKKAAATVVSVGVLILVTIDLWGVDKRYLNDNSFSKQKLAESYHKTKADASILEDKSPSYRVLNMSSLDTFSETRTSYFHKSIGGYHAAKLRRYQELVDRRVSNEMKTIHATFQTATSLEDLQDVFANTPTLNMLNAKYLVYHQEQAPLENTYTYGNAWFIKRLEWAENADEEMEALNRIDPRNTAVVDKKFTALVGKPTISTDENDTIQLLVCKPNLLKYESIASTDQVAVFSEVYYNHGWKAFVDGKPAEHFRANWILRAMNVPAGKHTIEFRFEPDTYFALIRTGSIASLVLFLGIIGSLIYSILKIRKTQRTPLQNTEEQNKKDNTGCDKENEDKRRKK